MSVSIGLCLAVISFVETCFGDEVKPSKATQTIVKSSMVDWSKLEVVDYLRSGALIVAFFAVLLSDKRGKRNGRGNMWVNAEIISFLVSGLALYFFPSTFLEYMVRTSLGPMHVLNAQVVGCLLVGAAVITARQRHSIETDSGVHFAWLVARLIASSTMLLFVINSHQSLDVFTEQHKVFGILGVGLWFLGNIYQYFTRDTVGGMTNFRSINSNVNFYLLAGCLMIFTYDLNTLIRPEMAYDLTTIKPDAFALQQIRGIALLAICLSMQMVGALFYANDDDKRSIFVGQLVIFAMHSTVVVLNAWKHNILSESGYKFFAFGTVLNIAINLRGYYVPSDKIKTR